MNRPSDTPAFPYAFTARPSASSGYDGDAPTTENAPSAKTDDATATAQAETGSGARVEISATLTAPDASGDKNKDGKKGDDADKPPIVTRHMISVNGVTLAYTVTTGFLPIKNDKGETEARIFYMAYTRDAEEGGGADRTRPLMFSFNGGPGSSSVWLHLGALGPKRVPMKNDGELPPPPYALADNEATWLSFTDLVFIDPVGTGFSRAETPDLGKKFWSVSGDIASVGEFIRLYLTRNQRWTSPLYLVGESYGTTRAAGLAEHLIEKGIALSGIALVSSILNFQTALSAPGNDLPFILFLPTYTATAFYHNKLAPELQAASLPEILREAEAFAENEYAHALARGDRLTPDERRAVAARVARYTGLSEEYVLQSELRVDIHRFCKELLRTERKTVGRLDARITGRDRLAVTEHADFDPSMSAIRPPYTATFNDYIRRELGFETDEPYHILGGGFSWDSWKWEAENRFTDTSDALASAFYKNPYLRLFVASGYYDLATPYFATSYTLAHMGIGSQTGDDRHDLRQTNITTRDYPAGHMMYTHGASLLQLKTDVEAWLTTGP